MAAHDQDVYWPVPTTLAAKGLGTTSVVPSRGSVAPAGLGPLAGFSIAVAAEGRRHPLASLLESLGARTVKVPAMRSTHQHHDARLREATRACVARRCDDVVISSAQGLRGWLAAARRWGMADELVARLGTARLLVRDTRTADNLRELGLTTGWSMASATTEGLLRYLSAHAMVGRRVVVQLDQSSLREACHALRLAGADVVEAPTYQTSPPAHMDILRRLSDQIVRRQVDAVALVGENAALNLLDAAHAQGRLREVVDAFGDHVLCACLGALTAAPMRAQGLRPVVGTAPFVADLARALVETVPRRAIRLAAGGHRLEVRGEAVVLNGRLISVQAGPTAVLRALARHPGRVLSCAEIRQEMHSFSDVDDHAIEMAVSRLRRALGGTDLVQTVVKRGYRMAV